MKSSDLSELHSNLRNLSRRQQLAIHLRFWERFTIAEVAKSLGMTWDEADRLIETTLRELRSKLTNLKGSAHCAA